MTAAEELAALLEVLRTGGASVYVGPVPGEHWRFHATVPQSVRLEMAARRVEAPESTEEKPAEPPAKVDAYEALEKRLFPPELTVGGG